MRTGWKAGWAACAALTASAAIGAPPGPTPVERRWIETGEPVLAEARRAGLPLDIVVQPQPNAGEPTVAMAWVAGRCKLVLTMRGPGGVPLEEAAVELPAAFVEAVVAHETGHCWRHATGAWHAGPAGFAGSPGAPADDVRAARREEGFADLVALAWTAARAPDRYAAVHAWLTAQRTETVSEGTEHDTRDWLAAAADPASLAGPGDPFERALRLWSTVTP